MGRGGHCLHYAIDSGAHTFFLVNGTRRRRSTRPASPGQGASPRPGCEPADRGFDHAGRQLNKTDDWISARIEYERLRHGRTRKVVFASVTTGDVLHLPDGPRADERIARLAAPHAWDRHLDWVHGSS